MQVLTALIEAGREQDAITYLVERVQDHPTWPQLHFDILSFLYRNDPLQMGVFVDDCLAAAVAQPSSHVLRYLAAVGAHVRGPLTPGAVANILAMYDQVTQRNPRFASAYFHAGIAAHTLRDFGRATACAQQPIRLEPKMAEPHFLLSTIHSMHKRNAEAVHFFQVFLERACLYLAKHVQRLPTSRWLSSRGSGCVTIPVSGLT